MTPETKKIKGWLKDHPLFKVAGMCAQLKIDKSNFNRILKGDADIPEKMVEKIILVLRKYGYMEPIVMGKVIQQFPLHKAEEKSDSAIQSRIMVIESELANPPKNPLIGIKTWKAVREKEIAELKSKLK